MFLAKLFSFKHWSLRARVSALVAVPLISITLLTLYNINAALNRETVNLQTRGEKLMLLAADAAQLALFAGDEASLDNLSKAIMGDQQIAGVLFFDEEKQLLSKKVINTLSLQTDVIQWGRHDYVDGDFWYFVQAVNTGSDWLDDSLDQSATAQADELLGWVMLVVDLSESRRYRAGVLRNNLLVALALLSLALWLAFRFSRAVVRPLSHITAAVTSYSEDDFSQRVEERSAGELGNLEKGINHLAERVGQSQKVLKQEVARATDKWIKAAEELESQNIELIDAKHKADEANEAKSDFLARMSHELRTPLTGIMGFIRLLAKTDQPKMREEYSEIILSSSEVLLSTINDILDFSKLQANSFSLHAVDFQLEECLQDVLNLYRVNAFEKHIELNLLIDSDVPAIISTDIDKLRKVLSNIVSNAVKFTESGDVVVFVSLQHCETNKAVISVSVKDSGVGISETQLSHLFDPFFQCDESNTRSHDGTGLGLSIVQDFVVMFGGEVNIESAVGEGTEVEFSFCCDVIEPANNTPLDKQLGLVAIYDANPWTRRALRNQLHKFSAEVVVFKSYTELLRELEIRQFDAVLCGVSVSNTDSLELINDLERLKVVYEGALILALADEGRINMDELERHYSALSILTKPVTKQQLQIALNRQFGEVRGLITQLPKLNNRVFSSTLSLSGLSLLLAEDNPFNQKLLIALLQGAGATVQLAVDGEEAYKYAVQQHYDALVVDLHMPKLNGLQLSEAIRSSSGLNSDTPIILLTADMLSQQAEVYKRAGINMASVKPVNEHDLLHKIQVLTHLVPEQQSVSRPLLTLTSLELEAELNAQLKALGDLITVGEREGMLEQLHQLQGVAGLSGIKQLSRLLHDLQQAVQANDIAAIECNFQKLQQACTELSH